MVPPRRRLPSDPMGRSDLRREIVRVEHDAEIVTAASIAGAMDHAAEHTNLRHIINALGFRVRALEERQEEADTTVVEELKAKIKTFETDAQMTARERQKERRGFWWQVAVVLISLTIGGLIQYAISKAKGG